MSPQEPGFRVMVSAGKVSAFARVLSPVPPDMTRFRPSLHSLDDRITPTLSFASAQTIGVGTNPNAAAVGDFNGDGRADLAVANFGSNTASVLLNATPSGATAFTFSSSSFTVGTAPNAVAVADFNGDGRPDIVTANRSANSVSVLFNATAPGATTPSFVAKQDFSTGTNPLGVAVADFNGDGRPDIVTANNGSNTASVLLNTTPIGSTTATFAIQFAVAVGNGPNAVAVGDFNGDGRADFATSNFTSNNVSVLLNVTAAGATVPGFASQQVFATGNGPQVIAVGDFNGDGRPDVAATNFTDNTASVLLNTTAAGGATPNFAAKQDFATGSSPIGLVAGDFDGDGRADLAVANSFSSSTSVLVNATASGATTPNFAAKQDLAAGANLAGVAVGDFDGDGRADLVGTQGGASALSVYRNTSTGAVATAPSLIAQFGTTGVWGYNRTSNAWTNLNTKNATALAVAPNGNAVANFGANGVWYYRPLTGWTFINSNAAAAVAIDRWGNAYASFQGFGTAVYRPATGQWATLPGTGATANLLAVSDSGEVFANFNGYGVYRFRPQTNWVQINGNNATALAADPSGYVVASFNGYGVGQYIPYANGWRGIAAGTATAVTVDGSGNISAAFTGFGVGRWSAITNTWTSVSPNTPAVSLAADWFGNLFLATAGTGVWEYSTTFGLTQRRANDAALFGVGR